MLKTFFIDLKVDLCTNCWLPSHWKTYLHLGKYLCISYVYQTPIVVCGKFYHNLW
jgi:hypothetical protein